MRILITAVMICLLYGVGYAQPKPTPTPNYTSCVADFDPLSDGVPRSPGQVMTLTYQFNNYSWPPTVVMTYNRLRYVFNYVNDSKKGSQWPTWPFKNAGNVVSYVGDSSMKTTCADKDGNLVTWKSNVPEGGWKESYLILTPSAPVVIKWKQQCHVTLDFKLNNYKPTSGPLADPLPKQSNQYAYNLSVYSNDPDATCSKGFPPCEEFCTSHNSGQPAYYGFMIALPTPTAIAAPSTVLTPTPSRWKCNACVVEP